MYEPYSHIEVLWSAYKLVKDVLHVEPREEVVVTYDTRSDMRVVEAIASAVRLVGGKPLLVGFEAQPGVGRAAEAGLPVRCLEAVLSNADVWIEVNTTWLLYSRVYESVLASLKARYICLVGLNASMLVRLVGWANIEAILEFQRRLASITAKAKRFRITSPSGMDVEFENDPSRPVFVEGEVKGPGEYMLFGQVDWAPIEESINGVIVFDGSIYPPIGKLSAPVTLEVERGRVKNITGGIEASKFKSWLESLNDPKMFMIAHISYGCHPHAILSGNIVEDERVWGVVEWGLGSQSPGFKGSVGSAKSHTDGVCLRPTVWADGVKVIEDGEYVHPELKPLVPKVKQVVGYPQSISTES